MELGMDLGYILKLHNADGARPFEEAAALCREAGFGLVDYSGEFTDPDWERIARAQRETLDRYGIRVGQTHAPFNRYGKYDGDDFGELYRRVFETSKILGAKYVVVHGDEYRTRDHYDPKEILDYTYEYLAPFVEYAEKNGLVVAVENLFEDISPRCVPIDGRSRFTATVEELLSVVERFDSPCVRVCWDFGHARCAYGNGQLDALKRVSRYLACTHVHDNYYNRDLHLVPFFGDVDWEGHMRYLKECGYAGDLSLELGYGHMPDALLGDYLALIRKCGERLLDMAK